MGSHLVDLLVEKGYKVRATDLKTANKRYLNKSKNVEFIPADVTKKKTLIPLFKDVEVVFHTAAILKFEVEWRLLYNVNVEGTRNLCEIALDSNVKRMIVWSSETVYGKTGKNQQKKPNLFLPLESMKNPKPSKKK